MGLEKAEPRAVETLHGTFRGGYHPLHYDPNSSRLGERIATRGEQRFEPDYQRATTAKGHTIARVDNVREPLSLDPDIVHWKLGQAVHDLANREAIVGVDKLLGDRRVVASMDQTIGREQRQTLDRWHQAVANDGNTDTRSLAAMNAFFHRLRTNSLMVGIGFRDTTAMKYGMTALSNSIGELGPRWMLHGTLGLFGTPEKFIRMRDVIFEKSLEMRHRVSEMDRDIRDLLRDVGTATGLRAAAARYSHYAVATLDQLSALPTWLGAHGKAMAKGVEEADAIAYADKTVRNAHGANRAPDTAEVQRGSETQKLFTQFYGFFNHILNRQVVGVRAGISGVRSLRAGDYAGAGRDFAKTLSTFFFNLAVPSLIEAAVTEGGPGQGKGEGWLGWAAHAILGEVPAGILVLRNVAKAAMSGWQYEMSPGENLINTALQTGKDAGAALGLRHTMDGAPAAASSRWL